MVGPSTGVLMSHVDMKCQCRMSLSLDIYFFLLRFLLTTTKFLASSSRKSMNKMPIVNGFECTILDIIILFYMYF